MKVLVYFQPNSKRDIFEGARIRNTIKGALEIAETRYTSNLYDSYDVAHFLSPDDEFKINVALEKGVPVVVSALFGENDPAARFLNHKSKDGKRSTFLKPKALRMMNKATLVLAPCESAKQFLIDSGVTKPIEVVVPGINLARFNFSRTDEKELFYRYFREDKNKRLVLAIGEYSNNMEGLTALINAARKREDVLFYYVGSEISKSIVNKVSKIAPKNLHFTTIVHDDIYRSMLLNATVFMLPGYNLAGVTSIVEAMAANCQLIVRKSAIFPDFLKNEKTAYIAEFSETLTSLCLDYLDSKIDSTTEEAYQKVSEYNLQQFGNQLLTIYGTLINR
ncbi:MAG TPA: glycosyltransferase [Erysipelotrichaceae bacterium]|nr:glycosyltransferase [Erysipelotrichaceae bacterium]